MSKATYIDGVASSQAIDTAGEIVDIAGLDCSSLLGGAFNYEHKSDVPAQLVGKVLEFKKIFSKEDCENERHLKYWKKCQMPFLYVMGRLFDDKKDSAKEMAALFQDDAEHPGEQPMVGFSIEGAKIHKEGMTITRSIARKVTCTNAPANKQCVAELLPAKAKKSEKDVDSLFKGEIEFFNPNAQYLEFLEKKEKDMTKDTNSGDGGMIGEGLAMSEIQKSMAPAWKHTGGGNFSHPEHGIVSIAKQPTGEFHVRHNGAMAGLGGVKASFGSAQEAGAHAGNYMRSVSQNKVHAPSAVNRPSPVMAKAMTAGNSNVAPGQLEGGAALAKEAAIGHLSTGKSSEAKAPKISESVMISTSMGSMGGGMGKKEKSKWLARAEQAYKTWEKKEEFRSFMTKSMPHLTKGEIDAIGQVLALKKSVEAEKSMSKLASFYGKKK